MDSLLYKVVDNINSLPNILIHAGSKSYHFKEHIIPFINYCYGRGLNVNLDICDYEAHNELLHYFPNLLMSKIVDIFPEVANQIYISKVKVIKRENNFLIISNAINADSYAWYVYLNGEKIYQKDYSSNNTLKFYAEIPGEYRFVSFVKNNHGEKAIIQTQKIIVR